MNAVSWLVLAAVVALAVLAVRRNVRKGVPCEGGCSCNGRCAGCPRRCAAHAAQRRKK
ncbi:MAG: hypothetical protein IJS32_01920 [Kiritimatiellae bacterium]|nr:hypothetical protein [Kiritimatiellia bacterium]